MEKLILNENNVQLQTEAKDWEEAVRIGAEMLVSQGCAEQSYVEGIISAIKELGPYIIVADGLAMPHTRPECGATGIGCSLITLKEPVYFDGDKEQRKPSGHSENDRWLRGKRMDSGDRCNEGSAGII